MKKVNRIIAVVFLIFIGCFAIKSVGVKECKEIYGVMATFIDKVKVEIKGDVLNEDTESNLNTDMKQVVSNTENSFNNSVFLRQEFIDFYGSIQKTLNKKVQEDIAKDNNNILHNVAETRDVTFAIDNLNELSDFSEEKDIKFLYVQPPSKVMEDFTVLPKGVTDSSNENIDEFLKGIEDVNYLDLRNNIDKWNLDREKMFYKTDHHWTIESVFRAYSDVIDEINHLYKMNLDPDNVYTDIENFSETIYEENFLGSQGNKLSEPYSGLDDFNLILPNFQTDFTLTQILKNEILHEKKGTFKEALVYEDLIKENERGYSIESYTSYLGYGNTEKRIVNNSVENDKKVLVIGDSYSRPFSAFLSLCFKETRNLDTQPGRFEENIYDYISEYDPDIVVVMFYEWSLGAKDTFNFKRIELQ
ncbi:MAG: hypothetical protein E6929_12670 [Clostridium sp.]|nr:hypothetical protein [Clostridium sp.]